MASRIPKVVQGKVARVYPIGFWQVNHGKSTVYCRFSHSINHLLWCLETGQPPKDTQSNFTISQNLYWMSPGGRDMAATVLPAALAHLGFQPGKDEFRLRLMGVENVEACGSLKILKLMLGSARVGIFKVWKLTLSGSADGEPFVLCDLFTSTRLNSWIPIVRLPFNFLKPLTHKHCGFYTSMLTGSRRALPG